jgi:predicted metalloendopeptidase
MADDSRPIIGLISGIARPTRMLRRRLLGVERERLTPQQAMVEAMRRAAEDEKAVASLASLMEEAMEKSLKGNGLVDMKDAAAYVLRSMQASQG